MSEEPSLDPLLEEKQASFWSEGNLNERVFHAQRWFESLAALPTEANPEDPASAADSTEPTLLFVLDNDYGELTTVMYLLAGQSVAARSTVLLPERLHERNAGALPGRTFLWQTEADIRQAVEERRPDVVLFCSGYLFSIHELLSADALERLVGDLRARGCAVVTADPYLGVLSKRPPRETVSIDIPDDAPALLKDAKVAADARLHDCLTAAERVFRDCQHLYPSHPDLHLPETAATSFDARNVSFYNPRLILPNDLAGLASEHDGDRPHWIFIISAADVDTQGMFEGPWELAGIIADRLRDAVAAGRHAILVGPDELVRNVFARLPNADGIDTLSFLAFDRIIALLLTAEHALYWNVVSHSILMRLFNGLPVVLFDRGHLVRAIPSMTNRVVAWYYQGWSPPYLDHHQPLTLEALRSVSNDHRAHDARMRCGYQRAPEPSTLVPRLAAPPSATDAGG